VSTKTSAGAVTKNIQYSYDAFGKRIAKLIDADGAGSNIPTAERLIYDGDNIILSFDGNNAQTHRYLHGPGVDQVLADEVSTTNVLWALSDHQGTVRDVVNNAGTVVNHIRYDSFGKVTGQTSTTVSFRYGFTGRENDTETGLNYYRSRYQDPSSGQFISQDKIGFEGDDTNLYRYVNNNPLNMTDPSGKAGEVIQQFRTIGYTFNGSVRTADTMADLERLIPKNSQTVPDIRVVYDKTIAVIRKGAGGPQGSSPPYGGKLKGDQNGHIVPRELGGNTARNNMFAQNAGINIGPYQAFGGVVNAELTSRPILTRQCPPQPILLTYTVTMAYNQSKIRNDPELKKFPLRPTNFAVTAVITSDSWTKTQSFPNPK
jgi:RHS repeat-associated protein